MTQETLDICKVITDIGYMTKSELFTKFPSVPEEVMNIHIDYLLSKNTIKKVRIAQGPDRTDDLFYIPA